MRVFGKMYDKRKQKIADSAAAFLEAGETPGPAAICQSERQARLAVVGKMPYKQFLATATDQHFYLFAISPMKKRGLRGLAREATARSARGQDGRAPRGYRRIPPRTIAQRTAPRRAG
jgi:hypothetical protein